VSRTEQTRLHELERLYESRFPQFVRVAQAVVGDRESALDAVQDAFANVVRARSSFRGEGSLEAWVWRAVVNAARTSMRCRQLTIVAAEPDEDIELPAASPELAPLVAALPERQRLVVFLRYYADLDYRSIGSVLGIEVGTVSATLASAHAAIRRGLEEVQSRG